MLTIRLERHEDHDDARRINDAAFGPGSVEAGLVDALRTEDAHVPELCLVAVEDEEPVGHLFFSKATLASGHAVLALAPMAVLPERQGQGIGSRLVREGLRRAAATAYPLVVVLGHPGYYPRFGFEPAASHGVRAPWDVPPEAWMVHRLPAYAPEARGLVTYNAAFDAVT